MYKCGPKGIHLYRFWVAVRFPVGRRDYCRLVVGGAEYTPRRYICFLNTRRTWRRAPSEDRCVSASLDVIAARTCLACCAGPRDPIFFLSQAEISAHRWFCAVGGGTQEGRDVEGARRALRRAQVCVWKTRNATYPVSPIFVRFLLNEPPRFPVRLGPYGCFV